MYRRVGFEVVFRRPRYYRDNNEDALLMSLDDLPGRLARWQSKDIANRGNVEGGSL
jgi:hypothetical protein